METTTTQRYVHPHEAEELEMRFGPRLWDATPGVCCAAFQLGACQHTEALDWEYELANMDPAELAELAAQEAEYQARKAAEPVVDEPF